MDSKTADLGLSMYPKALQGSIVKAIEFQQNSYELSSDWHFYEADEHEYLKCNIRYSIRGQPDTGGIENDSIDEKMDEDSGERKSEDKEKEAVEEKQRLEQEKREKLELDGIVELVYDRIVKASRTKNSLYVGIIFNILCDIKSKDKTINPIPVPVFKVKRCMENDKIQKPKPEKTSKKAKIGRTALYPCCVCYVDSEGRIYEDWTDYVTKNTLPKCLMVLPMGGFYQENPSVLSTPEKTYVWIEIGPSPAARAILPFIDSASTVLSVGALGVGITALAAPIAAPVVMAGAVCGAVSGAYMAARSTQTLVDRQQHAQSISVTDRTARSAWLGVAGGMAGGLATGSTFLLNKAVRTGASLGLVTRTTYNAIVIGNMVVNGMGIGNGIYSIYQNYQDTKKVSSLEVAQVMAHILFFGNAIMNFKTARMIINDTQQRVLQDYEDSLRSNRHRKAFRRIQRVTRASNSDTTVADSEIIRGIRSIKNRDDFFAGVVRNRKIFNASNAEVTFKDGNAMINDKVSFDPVDFSQQPKDVKVSTINAAEPFTPGPTKSTFSYPNTMPEAVYKDQLNMAMTVIRSAVEFAQSPKTTDGTDYVKRLVFELQNFSTENKSSLISNLAKITLEIVQRTRRFVGNSIEELIYDLWLFVRAKVNRILENMGIDSSNMLNSPNVAELVYLITQSVVNEIFNGLENFLGEIMISFSQCSNELKSISSPSKCSICSGYILLDC